MNPLLSTACRSQTVLVHNAPLQTCIASGISDTYGEKIAVITTEVIQVTPVTTDTPAARPASTIALLAGIWLFVSPWVYGAAAAPNAWNSWIVGALIFIFAATRLNRPRLASVSWLNVILGIWTFISPWIYAYTGNMGRFINSLCVGVIVFVAAMISANAMPHGTMRQRHV